MTFCVIIISIFIIINIILVIENTKYSEYNYNLEIMEYRREYLYKINQHCENLYITDYDVSDFYIKIDNEGNAIVVEEKISKIGYVNNCVDEILNN